ncbi:G-type lectin S-receptor-like serine/threonine-protein kinase RLK1 [Corchorus olitorius]|uniref:G-type lectin S-receptor-like serine/threonine-protein kinase RLK1 n=1 Tax=Corchorus olitorius TaxID=93759 RepID=A0A1R3ILT7_9ROSI|nr:G-type lectin S-receptor-like serine/threonine-protein kinase RLK1 [Corchorus olitorius]
MKSLGCSQNSCSMVACEERKDQAVVHYNITILDNMTWTGDLYSSVRLKEEECRKNCEQDCYCGGVLYSNGKCNKYSLPLKYGRRRENVSTTAFIKVYLGIITIGNGTPDHQSSPTPIFANEGNRRLISTMGISLGSVACLCQLQLINNTNLSITRPINLEYGGSDYDNEMDSSSSYNTTVYSARIDVDGNFRLYAHVFQPSGGFHTFTMSLAVKDSCQVNGFCGFNSFCTLNDFQPYCACLPGTEFIDPYQSTHGCKRIHYSEAHCKGEKAKKGFYNITPVENIDWRGGTFYSREKMSKDECNKTCLEDCNCEAAFFRDGICRKQKLPLKYLLRDSDKAPTVFMKMGVEGLAVAEKNHTHLPQKPMPTMPPIKRKEPMVKILVLTFSLVVCSCNNNLVGFA